MKSLSSLLSSNVLLKSVKTRHTVILSCYIHDALEALFCFHLTCVIRLETGLNLRCPTAPFFFSILLMYILLAECDRCLNLVHPTRLLLSLLFQLSLCGYYLKTEGGNRFIHNRHKFGSYNFFFLISGC